MPRESKIFPTAVLGVQGTITLYECFGWELLSWNETSVTMSRESSHPAYMTLVSQQEKFDRLFSQYLHLKAPVLEPPPAPIGTGKVFFGFLFLIVPGIIYLVYKKKERKKYDNVTVAQYREDLEKYEATKKELLEETKHISEEARALFFGL